MALLLSLVLLGTLVLLASGSNSGQSSSELQKADDKIVPVAFAPGNLTRRIDPNATERWNGNPGHEYGNFLYQQWTKAFVKGIDWVERIFAMPGDPQRVVTRQRDRQQHKDRLANAARPRNYLDPLYVNERVRGSLARSLSYFLQHRCATMIDTSSPRPPNDPTGRNRIVALAKLTQVGLLPQLTPKSWLLRWEQMLT